MKKEFNLQIFSDCSKFAPNAFWKKTFEDLGAGKCPYGVYTKQNYLFCYIKGKEFSYLIHETKSPSLVFQEVYQLFQNMLDLSSQEEKITKREKILDHPNSKKKEDWNNVKKKIMRDAMFEQYVLDNAKTYNLPIHKCKQILSFIWIGLLFKSISSKDITFEDGVIKKIKGFEFFENDFKITKNIYGTSSKSSSACVVDERKLLSSYWNLYLQDVSIQQ